MARTTATEVKAILDGCTLADATVDEFIHSANLVVTDVLGDDSDLSDSQLEDIERWLTAHLISATTWRTAKIEKVGEASVTYTGVFGKYLEMTPYGQMVKLLDTTGKMGNIGKKGASIYAITSFD